MKTLRQDIIVATQMTSKHDGLCSDVKFSGLKGLSFSRFLSIFQN